MIRRDSAVSGEANYASNWFQPDARAFLVESGLVIAHSIRRVGLQLRAGAAHFSTYRELM